MTLFQLVNDVVPTLVNYVVSTLANDNVPTLVNDVDLLTLSLTLVINIVVNSFQ